MIERVARALADCGLAVTAEELADLLWLAQHVSVPAVRPGTAAPAPAPPELPEASDAAEAPAPPEPERGPEPAPRSRPTEAAAPLLRAAPAPGGGAGRLALEVPAATALPRELPLARALRPLMRRVPSRTAFELDEDATVERLAESGLLDPVMRPRPERWLDVALVVDVGPSMLPWERTVLELHRLLERHGAFRAVRRWALAPGSDGPLRIGACLSGRLEPSRWSVPEELVDPTGRRLVVFLSDAVGPAWSDGRMARLLAVFGRAGPTVLCTPLPESLWAGTGLGVQHRVFLRGGRPAAPNVDYRAEDLDLWIEPEAPRGLPLPVVTLDPENVHRLAELVAATGEGWAPGVLFEGRRGAAPAAPPGGAERVARFLGTASPAARRLAAALAVVPLSLPIMRLVQSAVLPGTGPLVLAEVLRSGLLAARGAGADAPWEFLDGVRERLLDDLRVGDAERVLHAVSHWIERRAGKRSGFAAAVADPGAAGPAVGEEEQPFAFLAASALRRMGPRFAGIADRLEGRTPAPRVPSGSGEVTPEPSAASPDTGGVETKAGGEPALGTVEGAPVGALRALILAPDVRLSPSSRGAPPEDARSAAADARILALRLARYGFETAVALGGADATPSAVLEAFRALGAAHAPGDLMLLVGSFSVEPGREPALRLAPEPGQASEGPGLLPFTSLDLAGAVPPASETIGLLETDVRDVRALAESASPGTVLATGLAQARPLLRVLLGHITAAGAERGGLLLEDLRVGRSEEYHHRGRFDLHEDAVAGDRQRIPLRPPARDAEGAASVLWVDDQPQNNDAERLVLEQEGVEVTLALSTAHALELLRRGGFDAVVSDLVRPEGARAGIELLERVRSEGFEGPYVLYTAPGNREENHEALEAGAAAVITSPGMLLRRLRSLLGLPDPEGAGPGDEAEIPGPERSEAQEAPELLAEAEGTEEPERAAALAQRALSALGRNREPVGEAAWIAHHALRLRGLRVLQRAAPGPQGLEDLATALIEQAEALPEAELQRIRFAEEALSLLADPVLQDAPTVPGGAQALLPVRARRVRSQTQAARGDQRGALADRYWTLSYLKEVVSFFDDPHREEADAILAETAGRFADAGHAAEALDAQRLAASLLDQGEIPSRGRARVRLAERLLELGRMEMDADALEPAARTLRRAISVLHVQVEETHSKRIAPEMVDLGTAQDRLARVLTRLGRYDEAIDVGADAIDTMLPLRDQRPHLYAEVSLRQGERLVEAGRGGEAQTIADQLRSFARKVADAVSEARALRLLGAIALAGGDAGRAGRRYREALTVARKARHPVAVRAAEEGLSRVRNHGGAGFRSAYLAAGPANARFAVWLLGRLREYGVSCSLYEHEVRADRAETDAEALENRPLEARFDVVLVILPRGEKDAAPAEPEIVPFLRSERSLRRVLPIVLDDDPLRGLPSSLADALARRQHLDLRSWRRSEAPEELLAPLLDALRRPEA